jgi:hypothetical protein
MLQPEGTVLPPAPTLATKPDESPAETELRPRRIRKQRKTSALIQRISTFKRWSWRATGAWFWLHLLMRFFFGSDKLVGAENYAILRLEIALSFLGFSPTNKAIFPFLIKFVWLSLICEFSLIQVSWFVLVYLILFPLLALFFLFFGKRWRDQIKKNQPKNGLLRPSQKTFNLRNAAVALLAAWLLLYGGSSGKWPQLLGIILAGLFLLQRISSALSFAGPIEVIKSRWIEALVQISHNRVQAANTAFARKYERFIYRLVLRAAWVTRGSKGRSRAAMFVLVRYLLNLFTLGFATVLFWALVIRLNTPVQIGIGQALLASSARVLPGIDVPTGLLLPRWVEAGSSASAWILFVLYAGPAASIFPLVQQMYVNAMSEAHVKLREAAVSLLLHIREIDSTSAQEAKA